MICYDHKHLSDQRSRWACSTFRVQSKLASREKTGKQIAATQQGAEAEVKSFWACPLLSRLLSRAAPRDFEPIYQAPAGVINPGERAKNEMSLNSNCWNSKENKKRMLFCYFFSFASLHVALDVGLGFITCNFPLKSFLFHDDSICVWFIWSPSLFSRKSCQGPHVYQWYVT